MSLKLWCPIIFEQIGICRDGCANLYESFELASDFMKR